MSELPLFISPAELSSAMDNNGLRIVAVDGPEDFEAAHIPGAVRLDYADITRNDPPVVGLMPPAEQIAEALSAIGLAADDSVVAYDRTGGGQAGRLLYTLDALGHSGALSLLDGGLAAWAEADLPLEDGAPSLTRAEYHAGWRGERVADRASIAAGLKQPGFKLLDTRSHDEYTGADQRAARGGHIPGAAHLNWVDLKDHNGRLLPREQLLALLADRGITPENQVITYCQSHHRSSYAYWVLKALGFDPVGGYPGAWSDWGNAEDTPIQAADP